MNGERAALYAGSDAVKALSLPALLENDIGHLTFFNVNRLQTHGIHTHTQ